MSDWFLLFLRFVRCLQVIRQVSNVCLVVSGAIHNRWYTCITYACASLLRGMMCCLHIQNGMVRLPFQHFETHIQTTDIWYTRPVRQLQLACLTIRCRCRRGHRPAIPEASATGRMRQSSHRSVCRRTTGSVAGRASGSHDSGVRVRRGTSPC